ncbi:MAG: Gfo/Idh/MocA family oxidoreductase, partial [Bacteroidota bacterium]
MKKIKLAVLGIGRIGKIHFDNIRQHIPNAEIVAVSAATRRKEDFKKEFGDLFFSNNPEDAVNYPGVDAVLICTSTSTHADLIELVIKHDKHIFCEKPMDLSLERTTALARIIEKSANKVMLGFNRRFDPDM